MEDTHKPVDKQVSADQQVTSKTPATRQKNPKRVAAGKATAEKTRIAREALKKAFIERTIAQAKPSADPPAPPAVEPPPVSVEPPPAATKNVLTTTQWLSIISIVVSLAGVYYKREEIKNVLSKKAPPPSPVLPRAPPPSPVLPTARIRQMD